MPRHSPSQGVLPVWFMTVVTVPIVVGLLWIGSSFLIPLAIAALFFILSSALVDRIEALRIFSLSPPSWLAHLISLTFVVIVVLVFSGIVSATADEVVTVLPEYEVRLSSLITDIGSHLHPSIVEAIGKSFNRIELGAVIGFAVGGIGGTFSTFALVFLYLVFLFSEKSRWAEKIPRLTSSEEGAARLTNILQRIDNGVKQYIWVNALTSALSATVAFGIFSLVGLDFASFLALIVFVAGFIPNIGAFIGVTLPSLIALLQFDSLTPFLIVLGGYGIADQVIGNILQPSLQGRSLNISTFMVMVFLAFWATVWGGIGAFLAIPMMFILMVICSEIPETKWIAVLLSSDGILDED